MSAYLALRVSQARQKVQDFVDCKSCDQIGNTKKPDAESGESWEQALPCLGRITRGTHSTNGLRSGAWAIVMDSQPTLLGGAHHLHPPKVRRSFRSFDAGPPSRPLRLYVACGCPEPYHGLSSGNRALTLPEALKPHSKEESMKQQEDSARQPGRYCAVPLPQTEIWAKLTQHAEELRAAHLRDLLAGDPKRFEKLSFQLGDMLVDFSKNRVTDKTIELLLQLAEEAGVPLARESMFKGEPINWTESRPALHTALRAPEDHRIVVNGKNVVEDVHRQLKRLGDFAESLRSGKVKGATGKAIEAVVNIGIGGSHLGPNLVVEALRFYHLGTGTNPQSGPAIRFISNVDGTSFEEGVRGLDPEKTLFVVSSKSFTTLETMTNARTALAWVEQKTGREGALAGHFAAVTASPEKARDFGIPANRVFQTWDWVGGRYSCWSAVGLPIACAIGFGNFLSFLEGARELDEHFRTEPLRRNIPVLMGLIGVWYINFLGAETQAILPYDQYLSLLPSYLQQADMESNGKSCDRDGKPVTYHTGPIVWGEVGTNAQHSFFQLLHQGTRLVPADFIGCVQPLHSRGEHHMHLLSNLLAQTRALAWGADRAEVKSQLERAGLDPAEIERLLPYRVFPGNRPSTTILLGRLSPKSLGRLLALYEMKIFVQGVIWRVNSFDQYGVELGKRLAGTITPAVRASLEGKGAAPEDWDTSTAGLLRFIAQNKEG